MTEARFSLMLDCHLRAPRFDPSKPSENLHEVCSHWQLDTTDSRTNDVISKLYLRIYLLCAMYAYNPDGTIIRGKVLCIIYHWKKIWLSQNFYGTTVTTKLYLLNPLNALSEIKDENMKT